MTTDHVPGDEDSTAEVILASNGFQLTVNYMLVLPQKKP